MPSLNIFRSGEPLKLIGSNSVHMHHVHYVETCRQ